MNVLKTIRKCVSRWLDEGQLEMLRAQRRKAMLDGDHEAFHYLGGEIETLRDKLEASK